MKKKISKATAILLVLAMLAAFAGCGGKTSSERGKGAAVEELAQMESAADIIDIKPADGSEGVISPDTEFCISTTKKMDVDELKATLKLEPETDFELKKNSDDTYILSHEEPFEDGSLVRIKAFNGEKTANQWAFQTDGSLRVVSAYPNNFAGTDTGIQVRLSSYDVENFEDCFTVSPKVSGDFVKCGKAYEFVPYENLKAKTTYTVTISKDLRDSEGNTLGEDCSFSFKTTESNEYSYFYISHSDYGSDDTFCTDETPCVEIRGDFKKGIDFTAKVFSVDDDFFAEKMKEDDSDGIDFNGKSPVKEFRITKLNSYDGYVGNALYPSTFGAGKYITEISDKTGRTDYHFFQITDVSVYAVAADGRVTVWVNDSASGKVMADCPVTLNDKTVKTDGNGIASFNTREFRSDEIERYRVLLKVGEGENVFMTIIRLAGGDNDFYVYTHLSSSLYMPGDTVKVWGVVIPVNGEKVPDDLELVYDSCQKTAKITPDENGSFIFSFVTDTPSGKYGSVYLESKGEELYGSYCGFMVSEYELPSVNIDVSTDKNVVLYGDKVGVDIEAASFDGTPAGNTAIEIRSWCLDDPITVTTDGKGKAHAEIITKKLNIEHYDFYESMWFSACPADGYESENCSVDFGFILLRTDVILKAEYEGDKFRMEAFKVDMDKAKTIDKNDWWRMDDVKDIIAGEKTDLMITPIIEETYYTKKPAGKRYNYFTHKNEEYFDYEYQNDEKTLLPRRIGTGGDSIDLKKYMNHEGSSVMVHVKYGTLGIKFTEYFYRENEYRGELSFKGYTIKTDKDTCAIGETVTAEITGDTSVIKRALFISSYIDTQDVIATDSAKASFTFDDRYRRGTAIYGAFFDGKKVMAVKEKVVLSTYDFNLDVTVTPDKQSYKPGEEVTLGVDVRDAEGNPVSCVTNINVVDSALLAMAPNEIYIDNLAEDAGSSYANVYISTWVGELYSGDGGGGGGDGGQTPRKDFEDTPYFDYVVTDKNGKAEVKFVLPESVTEWTVTAVSIDKNGRSAKTENHFVSTLDFFICTTGTDTFFAKDDVVVAAKGMSKTLNSGENVNFKAVISDENGNPVGEFSPKANLNNYAQFNFGRLNPGSYKLKIDAACTAYGDSVEKEIRVVENKLVTETVKEIEIDSNTPLDINTDSTVSVRLVDAEYKVYSAIMDKLYSFNGSRNDMQFAVDYADSWWNGTEYGTGYGTDSKNYYGYRYSEYIDGEEDVDETPSVELTAKYALFNPDCVLTGEEFTETFDEKFLDTAEKLMILSVYAAQNEPVLTALYTYRDMIDELSDEEKVWLGIAFAAAGDYASAGAVYDGIRPLLTEDGDCLIFANDETYMQEYLTGIVSMLSFMINGEDSVSLLNTILATEYEQYLPVFELISYVENYCSGSFRADKAEINIGGKKQTVEFYSTGDYGFRLRSDEVRNTTITGIDSDVVALCRYFGNVSEAETNGNEKTAIKIISWDNLKRGDTFYLDFAVTADSKDALAFDFILPAGIQSGRNVHIVGCEDDCEIPGDFGYGHSEFDNRTYHCTLYGCREYSVSLECKACFSGDFTFEKAIASDLTTGDIYVSEEMPFTIG